MQAAARAVASCAASPRAGAKSAATLQSQLDRADGLHKQGNDALFDMREQEGDAIGLVRVEAARRNCVQVCGQKLFDRDHQGRSSRSRPGRARAGRSGTRQEVTLVAAPSSVPRSSRTSLFGGTPPHVIQCSRRAPDPKDFQKNLVKSLCAPTHSLCEREGEFGLQEKIKGSKAYAGAARSVTAPVSRAGRLPESASDIPSRSSRSAILGQRPRPRPCLLLRCGVEPLGVVARATRRHLGLIICTARSTPSTEQRPTSRS